MKLYTIPSTLFSILVDNEVWFKFGVPRLRQDVDNHCVITRCAYIGLITSNGTQFIKTSCLQSDRTHLLTEIRSEKVGNVNDTLIGDDVFGTSGVRGFVTKGGMLPPVYFTGSDREIRVAGFNRWLNNYINGTFVSHAPTPYPHCQVYINHHYKFIWIKGHKVAGTAMRAPLGSLCGDTWKVGPNVSFEYCSEPLFRQKNVTVSDIAKWWKEYFVFGIVRNPYTRFASAAEYLRLWFDAECDDRPQFKDICLDPYVEVRFCKTRTCCFDNAVEHHYRHFMDQSSCLFTDALMPAVDYLGETETLEKDFEEIIQEINRRKNPELPKLVNDLKKKNAYHEPLNHVRLLREEKSYAYGLFQEHQICLKTIYNFYHRDFSLLKYNQVESLSSKED
eukprot:g395.t1